MATARITTFHIGDLPRRRAELRIAPTRRPPRGVPKSEWPELFDVWLPSLAPSTALLAQVRGGSKPMTREKFFDRYEREILGTAVGRQNLEMLAQVARRIPISLGCYCEDETRCHRSRLLQMVQQAVTRLAR